jgi:orotidine-5'-phosphate decarboxylase
MNRRLIVALDVDTLQKAKALVSALYPVVKIFKIGNQLFTKAGPGVVRMVQEQGAEVFLDLKFHDIPNTVACAVKSACDMNVSITNLHASGGSVMMQAAVQARAGMKTPLLLAVTVLTSMDSKTLKSVGVPETPLKQVERLAVLAKASGMDGVVCSGREIQTVRKACGDDFIVLTPGIRMLSRSRQDQKRIMTPSLAIQKGADYIVVGRPITSAKYPLGAAKKILRDMQKASK